MSAPFNKFAPKDITTHSLQPGVFVGKFQIKEKIGSGGFGIVYLAWDPDLKRYVALKELFYSTWMGRGENGVDVVLTPKADINEVNYMKQSFLNEARMLATLGCEQVVSVYDFLEANGTAYMAMKYLPFPNLAKWREEYFGRQKNHTKGSLFSALSSKNASQKKKISIDEDWLRLFVQLMLDGLAKFHEKNVIHRDISPENIMIAQNGMPIILDVGAARYFSEDGSTELTRIYRAGYAPIEQAEPQAATPQGPWTDFYALGAVVYFLIVGQKPLLPSERARSDDIDLVKAYSHLYSKEFLQLIERALSQRISDRPQNTDEFKKLLYNLPPVHHPVRFKHYSKILFMGTVLASDSH
jgi:serine/threonine protein kinase